MPNPILYETHTHTTLCKHATGSISEYAQAALNKNFAGLTVTCHNPLPNRISHAVRMDEDQLPLYFDLIQQTRNEFAGRLDILTGMEFDFDPDFVPYLTKQIASHTYDYCLGSIHHFEQYNAPRYSHTHPIDNQKVYFDFIARAAESKLFDCISHPDIIKNTYKSTYNLDAIFPAILDMLDRVAATGVALELNTSGLIKPYPEMNPAPRILAEMKKRNIPVVIGSDSHTIARVAADWPQAFDLLESAGYTNFIYFKDRTPHPISITDARASLA